jgi:hypothetical protein
MHRIIDALVRCSPLQDLRSHLEHLWNPTDWTIVRTFKRSDSVNSFDALGDLAECCVLAIKVRRAVQAYEELTARGIFMNRTRHGDDALLVRTIVELRGEFPLRSAGAITLRAAALNHEARNDAVKTGAQVKTLLGKFLEVCHVVGRNIVPKLQLNGAVFCLDCRGGVLLGCHDGAKRNGTAAAARDAREALGMAPLRRHEFVDRTCDRAREEQVTALLGNNHFATE